MSAGGELRGSDGDPGGTGSADRTGLARRVAAEVRADGTAHQRPGRSASMMSAVHWMLINIIPFLHRSCPLVVTVHEIGHFLVARWPGVSIDRFAINFGRPLLKWSDKAGVEWRIGWIPLGGYVRFTGDVRPRPASPDANALETLRRDRRSRRRWRGATISTSSRCGRAPGGGRRRPGLQRPPRHRAFRHPADLRRRDDGRQAAWAEGSRTVPRRRRRLQGPGDMVTRPTRRGGAEPQRFHAAEAVRAPCAPARPIALPGPARGPTAGASLLATPIRRTEVDRFARLRPRWGRPAASFVQPPRRHLPQALQPARSLRSAASSAAGTSWRPPSSTSAVWSGPRLGRPAWRAAADRRHSDAAAKAGARGATEPWAASFFQGASRLLSLGGGPVGRHRLHRTSCWCRSSMAATCCFYAYEAAVLQRPLRRRWVRRRAAAWVLLLLLGLMLFATWNDPTQLQVFKTIRGLFSLIPAASAHGRRMPEPRACRSRDACIRHGPDGHHRA